VTASRSPLDVPGVSSGFRRGGLVALVREERERFCGQIPLGRFGEPAEIGQAIRFLASPAAGYITGATLSVDGGLVMA